MQAVSERWFCSDLSTAQRLGGSFCRMTVGTRDSGVAFVIHPTSGQVDDVVAHHLPEGDDTVAGLAAPACPCIQFTPELLQLGASNAGRLVRVRPRFARVLSTPAGW